MIKETFEAIDVDDSGTVEADELVEAYNAIMEISKKVNDRNRDNKDSDEEHNDSASDDFFEARRSKITVD